MTSPLEAPDLHRAHKHSSLHRAEVLASELCGCFYCLATYPSSEIEEWTDEDRVGIGQTALCPRCDIDSVIGSASGFGITGEFLSAMKRFYF